MSNDETQKTIIKLLNIYAERYCLIEEENKQLKDTIRDLTSNLQINKQIIQTFIENSSIADKSKKMLLQQKDENSLLSSINKKLNDDILNLNKKINDMSQNFLSQIDGLKFEKEDLSNQIFVLNNIIEMKNNQITALKNKKKKTIYSSKVNEVYIVDPSKVVNKLNDELILYKEITKRYSNYIKQLKINLEKSEKINQNLEEITHKYKKKIKDLSGEREKLNLKLTELEQQNTNSFNRSVNYPNSNLTNGITIRSFQSGKILNNTTLSCNNRYRTKIGLIQKLEDYEKETCNKRGKFDLDKEWTDTLEICNITQDEFTKFSKNKETSRLCDVAEYMYKLLLDKNLQVKLLVQENEALSIDNLKLNREILELEERFDMKNNVSVFTNNDNLSVNSKFKVQKKDSQDNENDNTNYYSKDVNKFNENIFDSVTSSEFKVGMAVDNFELASEM